MTNIYFVTRWDAYNDEHSEHLLALYLDKQEALDYAALCPLEHEETVTVEEKCIGVQKQWTGYIYEREYYDHTYVLFSMCWFDVDKYLTQDQVIHECILMASPMITENVDFDKLYRLYTEQFNYEDEE